MNKVARLVRFINKELGIHAHGVGDTGKKGTNLMAMIYQSIKYGSYIKSVRVYRVTKLDADEIKAKAKEAGYQAFVQHVESGLRESTLQVVDIHFSNHADDDVLEYAKTLKRPDVTRSFPTVAHEGVFQYIPQDVTNVDYPGLIDYKLHPEDYAYNKTRLTLVPTTLPRESTDYHFGIQRLVDDLLCNNVALAMGIAFGDVRIENLDANMRTIKRLSRKLPSGQVPHILKSAQALSDEIAKVSTAVSEATRIISEMVKPSGDCDELFKKTREILLTEAATRLVPYAQHESELARNLALYALKGVAKRV